jgi:fatty acid desaturase
LARLDNFHGLAAATQDITIIAATVAVSEYIANPFMYLALVVPIIGFRQRALATLLHESAHRTLARNGTLNYLLGTLGSGWWLFQSRAAYVVSHVRDHHGHFGDPDRDPDLRVHIARGLYDHNISRAVFAWRYLVRPLTLLDHPRMLAELVRTRLHGPAGRSERAGIAAAHASLLALLLLAGHADLYLKYWLVPLLLAFPVVNWYIELLELFPLVGLNDAAEGRTRHRHVGGISRHFFGLHNEGYHLDHHLSTSVPFWRLPELHHQRMRTGHYAAAVHESEPNFRWRRLGLLGQILRLLDQREEFRER